MAEINTRSYLVLMARLFIAGSFILSALPKIQDPLAFASSVEAYRVVDSNFSMWTALILPWLELVTGFGLLTPQIRGASAQIICVLLVIFIGLHASAWVRGLDISCGCFGESTSGKAPNYLILIFRNLAMLAATGLVIFCDSQFKPFLRRKKGRPFLDPRRHNY